MRGRTPHGSQGFTLIEILVVMFIVSILVGLSTLAVRGRDIQAQVDEDAERLLQLLTLAQEESLFSYRTLGVWVYESGYRFFEYGQGQWRKLANDRLLRSRQTESPEIELKLYLEGRPIALEVEAPESETNPQPHVVFFPDGTATPFELVVDAQDAIGRTLKGSPAGRLWREDDNVTR